MLWAFLVCLSLAGALPSWSAASDPDAIVGTWLVAEKDAHVEIYRHGDAYFGRLSWLRDTPDSERPQDMHEVPKEGLIIIRGFKFDGKVWKDGTLYDPTDGKTYRGTIALDNRGRLRVRGFMGISLIGKTTVWERVR
jgi:uncharacterized protein (DUF2147 family)